MKGIIGMRNDNEKSNKNITRTGMFNINNAYVRDAILYYTIQQYFNNNDKIWECPCHGSKFSYDGKSIEVPGINDLKK